jgi:hypothetical protein
MGPDGRGIVPGGCIGPERSRASVPATAWGPIRTGTAGSGTGPVCQVRLVSSWAWRWTLARASTASSIPWRPARKTFSSR